METLLYNDLEMRCTQSQFSQEVKELVEATEQEFIQHCSALLEEYKPLFSKKNQRISIDVVKTKTDLFQPGYTSYVSINIEPHNEKYNINIALPIWRCERKLLGILVELNIPGSRTTGTLITLKNAQAMFREFIEDNLIKD
ncbi:hypothetical protein AM500_04225 [Bacillus sp. FJAT-18017]|uniref:hypothetical protein n=1 Tax=Bacillus sp. FJAT-18017 TaxID=1705566 RepID=UPI0006AF6883|nr:hypothetical protein [Bacillus sp. FJAT-18017]ALC89087.1 hypothetical protein AM500_04225 [Bacillus sp. FJAT-18017]